MIYLLTLITILCASNVHAASASASATATATPAIGAADEKKASADEKALSAAWHAQPPADAAIAAAAEPEMKVRMGVTRDWAAFSRTQMEKMYRQISRDRSPRLVTCPSELLAHLQYVATLLSCKVQNDAAKRGIEAQVLPEDIYETYKALCKFITFPQDPTMFHTIQMALNFLNAPAYPVHHETTCRTLLLFLHANARRRTGQWLHEQGFDDESWFYDKLSEKLCPDQTIRELYHQELLCDENDRCRNNSKGELFSDPVLILEKVENEVRVFLRSHTSYGYGDVHTIVSTILRSVRLPKGLMAFSPITWTIDIQKRRYEKEDTTPFSSLCALVLNHLHGVCSQVVLHQIETGRITPDVFLDDALLMGVRLLSADLKATDDKLFKMSLPIHNNSFLYDCYNTRLNVLCKFLQGASIVQGQKTHQLPQPLLPSLVHYRQGKAEDLECTMQAKNPDFAARVHGAALLDLAVAQDPIDLIGQYCTEPGWSAEHADKMERAGNFVRPVLQIESNVGKLSQRGLTSLKGIESLRGISSCESLEVCYNPLSELPLKPLVRCYELGLFLSLTSLDLSYNNLIQIDLSPLSAIKTLSKLYLQGNELVRINGIEKLMPQLITFNVANNRLHPLYRETIAGIWRRNGKQAGELSLDQQRDIPDMTTAEYQEVLKAALKTSGEAKKRAMTEAMKARIAALQQKNHQPKHGKARRPNA